MNKSKVEDKKAIGEVTASAITNFAVEIWAKDFDQTGAENTLPAFGSFVCAQSDVIGVVYNVAVGPQDNFHKPQAMGLTREELKLEQPQIFALLRTEVQAACIGYFEDGSVRHFLPPHPAKVHDFVFAATDEEICRITDDFAFLRILLQGSGVTGVPQDELVAAAIRIAYKARNNDYDYLVDAGKALAQLLGDDYDRLMSILAKIKPHPHHT
jgi:hypothetical protein